jgi:hypothetical protein
MRIIHLQLEIVITSNKAELLCRLPIQVIQAVVISWIHRQTILFPALLVTTMGMQVVGLPSLLKNTSHREATVPALGTLNLRLPLTRCATTTLTSELLTLLVRTPENDEKADQIDADVRRSSPGLASSSTLLPNFISMRATHFTYMFHISTYVWDCFTIELSHHTSKHPALALPCRSIPTAERALASQLMFRLPWRITVPTFRIPYVSWSLIVPCSGVHLGEISFVLYGCVMTDDNIVLTNGRFEIFISTGNKRPTGQYKQSFAATIIMNYDIS